MEERGQIERGSRRMSLCHRCVASKFKQKSAYKVLKLSHTTTNNMPCYTQRAENTQPANQRAEQGRLTADSANHKADTGCKTALMRTKHSSHKPITQLTAKLANQEADSFHFLTSSSSPPLLRGEGSEEIKQYDSSSLLQIRRSLFTDRHEQQPTGF